MTFDNIRSIDGLDDTVLRTSLQTAKWNKHLPAIKDENGNVLVGHRRLKIAAEEGIEPVIKTVTFGTGPEADAERMRLAVISNVGGASLTKEDRKALAMRLYDQGRGLTMEAIAGIVGVTKMTVSRDLEGVVTDVTTPSRTSKRGRKGEGRPKRKPRPKQTDGKEAPILAREGVSSTVVANELGVSPRNVRRVRETAEIIEQAKAEPEIDPATLKLTDKKRFDFAVKQYQKKLDIQFERRVLDEIKKRIDEIVLPNWKQQIKEAEKLYERRRALMSKDLFNTIRRALHPDSRQSISDKKLGEAFDAFMGLEKYLLNENDSPTKFQYPDGGGIPDNLDEWDKMKAKATAARAKRPSGGNAVRQR